MRQTEELVLNWDDDNADNEDGDSPPLSMKMDGNQNGTVNKLDKEGTNIFFLFYHHFLISNVKYLFGVSKTIMISNILEELAKPSGQLDIMAQQLKFVACLKILMEELSTLATGFEVDGGQLRYQLYVWLEREVDALRQLCNYSVNTDGDANNTSECNYIRNIIVMLKRISICIIL